MRKRQASPHEHANGQHSSPVEPIGILRFVDNPTEPRQKAVSLRMSDLDRFGPSLLVDQRSEDGHRVLVWTD
jgi:hypothetical protein